MTAPRNLAHWQPPPRPERRPIEGAHVRLEPLDADRHAEDLHRAFAPHPQLWDYMPYGPFAAAADYHAWARTAAEAADPLFYALRRTDTGRCGGVASFLRIDPRAGSIEVGHICLSPDIAGSTAATEAMFRLMDWAFAAGYRRYEWKCNALNTASRRAAQRLGFAFEGVFRQHLIVKGRNRDTAWFSVIDGEWPALRAAFLAWLDPANHDAAGRQKRSLSSLTSPLLAARDPALAGDHGAAAAVP
jgi:RimJ/RimL family protein N-acetyltransferase